MVAAGPNGAAVAFDGAGRIDIPGSASLALSAARGFTFSAWVKPGANDNGTLLLNASITEIAQKLCFKTIPDEPDKDKILYAEESLKGYSVVMENSDNENSKIDLEQLFNGITENPEKAKVIFQ